MTIQRFVASFLVVVILVLLWGFLVQVGALAGPPEWTVR